MIFSSGVSRQAGRSAGALHEPMVPKRPRRASILYIAPNIAARSIQGMIGRVVVMEPAEFEKWLGGGATGMSMAELGASLFQRFGCATCHRPSAQARPFSGGPLWQDGETPRRQ